jgi:carbonic anhydrase
MQYVALGALFLTQMLNKTGFGSMEKLLVKIIVTILLLNFAFTGNVHAAQWTALHDNQHAKIMLDKQSIVASGKYQKAWVKIDYKTLQTNMEYPEKSYNNAKLLWYFNCTEQKSATAQVYQSLNEEQVYSAAIDIKRARFLEPVPETEADIAMHYVCQQKEREAVLKEKKVQAAENAKAQAAKLKEPVEPAVIAPAAAAPTVNEAEKSVAVEKKSETEEKLETEKQPKNTLKKLVKKSDKQSESKEKNDEAIGEDESSDETELTANANDKEKTDDKAKSGNKKRRIAPWKYTGSRGPEFWGDLSADYASCKVGMNQSPINIDKTITTAPKPLKTFQRFPAADIVNNGQTVLADFKPGNVLVIDGLMYQMKQVTFHAPSENQIMGKSFPLEAQFLHADANGNLAILAVMYEEGNESKAIAKLWSQMPKRKGKPTKLSGSVLAGELMPRQKEYYRFSGSLTTPPCSEGVVWVVMKAPMTVSKRQIDAFKEVIRQDNNRPIQALNGRMVIE